MPELVAGIHVAGLLRKARCEPALPCGIRGQSCGSVTPVCAQRLRVGLRRIRLDQLLPAKGTLLPCILNFLAALSSLRRGQTAQFTIFGSAKIALGAHLLTRIQARL